MQNRWKNAPGASHPSVAATRRTIRGRISDPVPITNRVDDGFPTRNSIAHVAPGRVAASHVAASPTDDEFSFHVPCGGVAGLAPVGEDTVMEEEPAQHHGPLQQEQWSAATSAASASGSRSDVAQERSSHPSPAPPLNSPASFGSARGPPRGASPIVRQANQAGAARITTWTERPATGVGHGGGEDLQRKQSTLRVALGKLFGKKRKHGGSQSSSAASGRMSKVVATPQPRVGPAPSRRPAGNEPSRSVSLPVNEYDRALRSHSVGPQDLGAIESARTSFRTEFEPNHRRAATATSRIMNYVRPESDWTGLSPRPSSMHGRNQSIAGIGFAISEESSIKARRRSRSLSDLHAMAASRLAEQRQRNDEARGWPESYEAAGLLSPMSLDAPDEMDVDNYDAAGAGTTSPDPAAANPPPQTPVQPFVFGRLTEATGMKITQAATLDNRIGSLEDRLVGLEQALGQLRHVVPSFSTPLPSPPRRGGMPPAAPPPQPVTFYPSPVPPPSLPASFSAEARGAPPNHDASLYSNDADAQSHLSFGEAATFVGSLHPPSQSTAASAPGPGPGPAFPDPAKRPASNTTVRGALASGADTAAADLDTNDRSQLLAQLAAERLARQALEAQVRKLSERLNSLSKTMFAVVRDPGRSRSHERDSRPPHQQPPVPPLPRPRTPSGARARAAAATQRQRRRPPPAVISAFETDDSSDDGQPPSSLWRSSGSADGIDGDGGGADGGDDDLRKLRAVRTLSLGQMTLGKGARLPM